MTRLSKFPAKITLSFCTLFCLSPCFAFSEDVNTAWVRRYNGPGNGDDKAVAIATDSSGNVYVTGYSDGGGTGYDYCTIKYLPNGDTAWVRRYDGSASKHDFTVGIGLDKSGNVYVTGTVASPVIMGGYGSLDIVTIKYLPNGNTAWLRSTYVAVSDRFDLSARGFVMDKHGNLYIAGEAFHPLYGSYGFTLKYDSAGNFQWEAPRGLSGPSYEVVSPIAVDSGGSRVCAIGSDGIFQYDSLGNQLWAQSFPGIARSVALDNQGNAYGAGNFSYYGTVVIKYNSYGDSIWVGRSGRPGESHRASFIATDKYGNVYLVGNYNCCIDYYQWITIKYDSTGSQHWLQEYRGIGSPNYRESKAMALNDSGNVYVTGYDARYAATLKYDALGNLIWEKKFGDIVYWAEMSSITADNKENVYVAGFTQSDFLIIKYTPSPILRGDLNLDAVLSITDVVLVLNGVFLAETPPAGLASCDINCDGFETPADVVVLLNMVFAGAAAPC